MQQLFQHISTYYKLSEPALEALYESLEKKELGRYEYLLTQGQVCRQMYFLEKGAIRGFYQLDGKDITHWFGFENNFVTSFHSFITGEASVENIQLEESSTLWAISKDKLTALYDEHHDIERLVRIAYENYYIKLEERYVNAQFRSAKERYDDLLKYSPHILERISLGHIASYLGISQETLSRIRSKH